MFNADVTYYNDFSDVNSINNAYVNDGLMQFSGYFEKSDEGLEKTFGSQGRIFCDDSSKLFSLSAGYVGFVLSFPFSFVDGVYQLLMGKDYESILWGVNVGNEITCPGIYASLTPDGIGFTIWTSAGKQTILNKSLTINANEDVFFEFMWDKDGVELDHDHILMRVNGIENAGNVPVFEDDIEGMDFDFLNTSLSNNNLGCIIKRLVVYRENDYVPDVSSSLSSTSSASMSESSESEVVETSSSSSSSSSSSGSFDCFSVQSVYRSGAWRGAFSTYTGKTLIAPEINGYIYISEDYGDTWSTKSNSSGMRYWKDAAANNGWSFVPEGVYLVSCAASDINTDYIYTSSDHGVSWTQRTLDTDGNSLKKYWRCVLVSSHGSRMWAGSSDGFYRSTNNGADWSKIDSGGWNDISGDVNLFGQYLVAIRAGDIYTSDNYGDAGSWTLRLSGSFIHIASSENRRFIIAHSSSQVFYSKDYGITWNQISSLSGTFQGVSISGNGHRLLVSLAEKTYLSGDCGNTWDEVDLNGHSAGLNLVDPSVYNSEGTKIFTAGFDNALKISSNYCYPDYDHCPSSSSSSSSTETMTTSSSSSSSLSGI